MSDPRLEASAVDPATSDNAETAETAKGDTISGNGAPPQPRRRYRLEDDTGFDEVPKKYRRFYRRWQGAGDVLAPNEVLCPVCKVVIRSARDLRVGDRVYCMPCMSRLTVFEAESGRLEARVEY